MISNSNQRYQHIREKIHCDVFFSTKDVTALRWISEINRILAPYQEYVCVNVHEVDSKKSREMHISTDMVVINNEKLEFYEVNKTLFELATNFINELKETDDNLIING